MTALLTLFATAGRIWHALPLIVVISLVYSATRHEHAGPILSHAARWMLYISAFMVGMFAILQWCVSGL